MTLPAKIEILVLEPPKATKVIVESPDAIKVADEPVGCLDAIKVFIKSHGAVGLGKSKRFRDQL